MIRFLYLLIAFLFCIGCSHREPEHFTHEVLNRMTPVKNQGESQTCWIYAMLAAIETEHLSWGDSVNLSPYYIEKKMEEESQAPESKRGMGKTLDAEGRDARPSLGVHVRCHLHSTGVCPQRVCP